MKVGWTSEIHFNQGPAAMSSINKCPQCGTEFPAGPPPWLCPQFDGGVLGVGATSKLWDASFSSSLPWFKQAAPPKWRIGAWWRELRALSLF
jgi:hypothetical protein